MMDLTVTEKRIRAEDDYRQLDFFASNGTYSISTFEREDGARIFLTRDQMKEFLEASLQIIRRHELSTET